MNVHSLSNAYVCMKVRPSTKQVRRDSPNAWVRGALLWGAQAASLPSSAACRRHSMGRSEVWNRTFAEIFRQAAEKDRFATANPSCGGLAACAPQHAVLVPLHDLSNAASTACCDITGTGCAG